MINHDDKISKYMMKQDQFLINFSPDKPCNNCTLYEGYAKRTAFTLECRE
jgi:hypothetical protein